LLEEIEAEIATKRLLDDLAVALSLASAPNADPAEYLFVETHCLPHFWHICITAYRCLRANRTLVQNQAEPVAAASGL